MAAINESLNQKMTALADEVRELSGTTTKKGLDAMTSDVAAANTEINEQTELLDQIATALEGKAAGSGGVTLPTLDSPANASDILSGKEAIDGNGNVITGSIVTKTSSDLTENGATVTVPSGYYATNATKSVTTATQATPSVSINSSGLITASATQAAGYVSAGTKSGTKQLTTQAAKTITPTTSSQTAVASGRYTTGAVTVAAIPSNYEDVADETNAYTTKISELETAVAALETELEGKTSEGSGGSIETCTMFFSMATGISLSIFGTNEYGAFKSDMDAHEVVEISVLKNSMVAIQGTNTDLSSTSTNIELQYQAPYPLCFYKVLGDARISD